MEYILFLLEFGENFTDYATDIGHLFAFEVEVYTIEMLRRLLECLQKLILFRVPSLLVASFGLQLLNLLCVLTMFDQNDLTLDLILPLLHAFTYPMVGHHHLSAYR